MINKIHGDKLDYDKLTNLTYELKQLEVELFKIEKSKNDIIESIKKYEGFIHTQTDKFEIPIYLLNEDIVNNLFDLIKKNIFNRDKEIKTILKDYFNNNIGD